MVKLVGFIPDAVCLSALAELRQPIGVFREEKPIGGLSALWLGAPDNPRVVLKLREHTVVFKFEIFELIAEPFAEEPDLQLVEIAQISGWDTVKCLFRFEWRRPAAPGELPANYGQVVGDRGRRENIPITASCVAVSMVGLGFWSTHNKENPVALIFSDDDDPTTFRVLDKRPDVEAALSECELVNVDIVSHWSDGSWKSVFR